MKRPKQTKPNFPKGGTYFDEEEKQWQEQNAVRANKIIDSIVGKRSVNHPPHYGGDTVYEAIKVIEAWQLDFCLGNAVKYISRAGKKDGNAETQDLEKAIWYLQRRVQQLNKKV
jgi:hypothetical protein